MSRIGVRRRVEEHRWCRECWVGWFEAKFRKTHPQKVVTLNVTINTELEASLAVTCTGLDGAELLRSASVDIHASRVGDIRQKLRHDFGSGEDLRLMPDGWFYRQQEFESWAASHEGGILPFQTRERSEGMSRHERQDDKLLDVLDRSEAHWQSVWAAAPTFTEQIHLCTSDGVFLAVDDDSMLLSILSDRNSAMRPAP